MYIYIYIYIYVYIYIVDVINLLDDELRKYLQKWPVTWNILAYTHPQTSRAAERHDGTAGSV